MEKSSRAQKMTANLEPFLGGKGKEGLIDLVRFVRSSSIDETTAKVACGCIMNHPNLLELSDEILMQCTKNRDEGLSRYVEGSRHLWLVHVPQTRTEIVERHVQEEQTHLPAHGSAPAFGAEAEPFLAPGPAAHVVAAVKSHQREIVLIYVFPDKTVPVVVGGRPLMVGGKFKALSSSHNVGVRGYTSQTLGLRVKEFAFMDRNNGNITPAGAGKLFRATEAFRQFRGEKVGAGEPPALSSPIWHLGTGGCGASSPVSGGAGALDALLRAASEARVYESDGDGNGSGGGGGGGGGGGSGVIGEVAQGCEVYEEGRKRKIARL